MATRLGYHQFKRREFRHERPLAYRSPRPEPKTSFAHLMGMDQTTIFNEQYRVIAVDDQSLVLRGIHSGELLTIHHVGAEVPLSQADFAVGQLVALNDPASGPAN